MSEVLGLCAEGLVEGRGDPVVALLMFYFDVLMYVQRSVRSSSAGPAAPIVARIEALVPRLSALRQSEDSLVSIWSWHLLSWMPTPVPHLARDALTLLPTATRSSARITLAFAAASTPEGRTATSDLLTRWLDRGGEGHGGEERDVAAMVLTQLHGDPQHPERTSDDIARALVDLAGRERWDDWEAAPAREHGYFADLAGCLVRAGYSRGDTTLPLLLHLVDVCSAAELESVLDALFKLFYHSQPYTGAAEANALSPSQRAALSGLVARPRVWAPRPRFYQGLQELGLPLGDVPMAAFLGIPPPLRRDPIGAPWIPLVSGAMPRLGCGNFLWWTRTSRPEPRAAGDAGSVAVWPSLTSSSIAKTSRSGRACRPPSGSRPYEFCSKRFVN